MSASALKIATLVSIGQHPASGRARCADTDSRALSLAARLAAGNAGVSLQVLHAGPVSDPVNSEVLRRYLGMGLSNLELIDQPADADVVPALTERLQNRDVDIILTGTRAETGEASGMTPYALAEALGMPMVPAVVGMTPQQNGEVEILQALPRGQRRRLRVKVPFVASVDAAAPESAQFAWARGQRGNLGWVSARSEHDTVMGEAEVAPARKRPKRIAGAKKTASAAERFKAATAKPAGKGGVVMVQESAEEKAQALYQFLIEQGAIK